MKKIYTTFLLGGFLAATSSNATFLDKKEVETFNDLAFIKKINGNVKSVYDAGGIYIANIYIQSGMDSVYITKDKKYLIAGGRGLSLEDGSPLTMPVENIAITKDKESFTFGKGDSKYILFTDPECIFCKKLESYLPQLEDKISVKIFYYPILQLHPNARELAKFQLSLKGKNKNVLDILSKTTSSPEYINRKISEKEDIALSKKIDEQTNIALELGVQGTPAIFTPDGRQLTWVQLLIENGIEIDITKLQ